MGAVDFAAFVDELAELAAEAILPFSARRSASRTRAPARFDPVTAADRAAEAAMRTLIQKNFPDHGIVGEEFGAEQPDAAYVWVLDPIDGTQVLHLRHAGLGHADRPLQHGVPVYGMMHQPFTGERFTGDGGSARYRGPAGERALHTRPCARLARRVALHDQPAPDEQDADRAACSSGWKRRRGSPATAAIATPIAWSRPATPISSIETGLQALRHRRARSRSSRAPAAASPSWDGGSAAKGGRIVAAGDPRLHAEALALLQS